MGWIGLEVRSASLEDLHEQREPFYFRWDNGPHDILLTRELSPADDGRVKMWRKRAREGSLPPLLVWWCSGLFAHVLLDGHDRVHAARLENVKPDVIVLADVVAHGSHDLAYHRQQALDQAALIEERVPAVAKDRASAVNAVLRSLGWDPRREWDLATPGFPLEGGVERWEAEVRGTDMEKALQHERSVASESY